MLYRINNATVSLGGEEILSHFDFEIHGTEKIAVVGRNGAGKTTLLRFIAGELDADRDDKNLNNTIEFAKSLSIAMLKQVEPDFGMMPGGSAGADECDAENDYEYDRLLTGFGFSKEDKERPYESFSGGEQTKLRMISLLLKKPDILLMDEPTNHLDMKTVEWLEEYLRGYEKAVVFVSHDRFFADRVADVVYEVENKKLTRYVGNYTEYRSKKLKDIEIKRKAWERSEKEAARLNALIEKFKNKPSKAAFVRSRRTYLARMERFEKPREDTAHIFTGEIIPSEPGAKWVINAEHLKCGWREQNGDGENTVRETVELSFKLQRGSRIAILGDNGEGKSTFLKTVTGHIPALAGKCTLGNNIQIGYFDQLSAEISSELTVFEHFRNRFPGLNDKELRNTLAAYLFRGGDAHKSVNSLSGGEKARLVLAEIITAKPNFLVLDEPTNHMDIEARETLESAFAAYKGTILLVSHDRYLISRLADSFYIFENGRALYYPFGYEHYLERLERLETARRINASAGSSTAGNGTADIALVGPARVGARSSESKINSEIMGMVSAEDQAIIAGLKAVPKTERHEIGFKTTEEAYDDWRMRLAKEALEAARRKVDEATSFEEYEDALNELTKAEADWYAVRTDTGKGSNNEGTDNQ